MTTKSYREFLKEQLRDPKFAAAYREFEPEFQVTREVIRLRLEKGSQHVKAGG